MIKLTQITTSTRRGTLTAAAAVALVAGALTGVLSWGEAIDHDTISVLAGGGSWGG